MASIKVEASLIYNQKLEVFMKSAGLDRISAIGHLVVVWLWCAENSPSGVLPKMTNREIAAIAKFWKDENQFVAALIEAGFLDKIEAIGLRVHDWDQWMSETVSKKVQYDRRKNSEKSPEKSPPNSSSSQVVSSSPVVMEFPVSGKTKTWQLREDLLEKLLELYPGVDVRIEAKKAALWCEHNPSRRKTATGMNRFLTSWMERQQNRGGGSYGNNGTNGGQSGTPEAKRNVPGKYAHLS